MLAVFLVLVLIGLTLVSPQWFLVRLAMILKGWAASLVRVSERVDAFYLKEYEKIRRSYGE